MLSSLSSSLTNARQSIAQALNFALVLSTAFMLWKGLSVAAASSSPIVVVLSGSMEPAFQRGDLLFLWNRSPRAEVGEIVVYNVRGKDIPIVHRVVRTYPEVEGKTKKVKEITVYVLGAIWKFFGVGSFWITLILTSIFSTSTPKSHMLLTKVRRQSYLVFPRQLELIQ